MATHIKRDCFARGSLHVEIVKGECQWCGQSKKRMRTYAWENDSNSCPPQKSPFSAIGTGKVFCDFSCFQSYSM